MPDDTDRGLRIPLPSGGYFACAAPTPEQVDLVAFAEMLAKTARFRGATPGVYYSVAQHSVLVSEILPETANGALQLWGLLHDLHEAPLADLSTPTLNALSLRYPGFRGAWTDSAARIDGAVQQACGIALQSGEAEILRQADLTLLATEARDLFPGDDSVAAIEDGVLTLPKPLPRRILPLAWDLARDAFLGRLRFLATVHDYRGPAVRRALRHLRGDFS